MVYLMRKAFDARMLVTVAGDELTWCGAAIYRNG